MAFSNPVTSSFAGNAYIDGLLWGSHWNDPAAGTRLKVYIAGQNGNEVFDFGGTAATAHTDPPESTAFQHAMHSSKMSAMSILKLQLVGRMPTLLSAL